MHLVHIPKCTNQNRNVHISVLNGALWDMGEVHCGICELGQLETIGPISQIWVHKLILAKIRSQFCPCPGSRAIILKHQAAFTQGIVLLQRGLAAPLPLDLLHRVLFVSGSGTVADGQKGTFTQGTVLPASRLVPKRAQQRRRKLAHGPNFLRAAKLPPASVKMPVEINWIQLAPPPGSAAPRHTAAKQRPV